MSGRSIRHLHRSLPYVFGRVWHAVIAVVVLVGLVIQIYLVARLNATPRNVMPGVVGGATGPGRYLRIVSFFTIQSNILSGVVCTQLTCKPARDGRLWRIVRLDALVGIAVTGIVYSTVLARVHQPHGWEQITTNALFHYIVPILMVLGWLLFGPRRRIERRVALWSLAWPTAWLCYTLIHGMADGWYPYPFVDVTTHGYGRVALNAVVVTLVFFAVAGLYWLGDRTLRPAPSRPADAATNDKQPATAPH